MSIYDYSILDGKGNEISLSNYKDKVILIINTATGCGFTPQYKELEELYEKYNSKGLEIIDIPCNQFKNQAPGSDEEITEFCQLHYNTKFPQMKKVDVNGENEIPLYKYLKSQQGFKTFGKGVKASFMKMMLKKIDKNYENNPDIKWNFTKFLVDKNGNVVNRFEPTISLKIVEEEVVKLL